MYNYFEIKDELQKSEEDVAMDRGLKKYVGKEVAQNYYHHFKKLKRVIEENL